MIYLSVTSYFAPIDSKDISYPQFIFRLPEHEHL